MSRFPTRTLVAYAALVGLPVLGLWLVLRAGAGLAAPPAVAGRFPAGDRARACFGVERLDVEQSGRHLEVRGGRGASSGRLDADRLTAILVAPAGSCAGQSVTLDAVVRDGELVGTLEASSCEGCASVVLRSSRVVEEAE